MYDIFIHNRQKGKNVKNCERFVASTRRKFSLIIHSIMKKIILTALFFIFSAFPVFLHSQWAGIYGGSDEDDAYCIQQTSDGGYIVAGRTHSFPQSQDYSNLWILKLDSDGNIEWQKCYWANYSLGEPLYGDSIPVSIQQENDGGYVIAGYTYNWNPVVWILSLNPEGDMEWLKTYDKSDNIDYYHDCCIHQIIDGGYILAGIVRDYELDVDSLCIIKISPSGDIEWQRKIGRFDYVYLCSLQKTRDGGYIIVGDEYLDFNYRDVWVMKLDERGDPEWRRRYGGSGFDYAAFIQQTGDGGYVVGGSTNSFGEIYEGYTDVWILKLTSSGDVEWQRAYGGTFEERTCSVQQTSNGGYIVGGETRSFGSGKKDIWILKLSSSGGIEWQRAFGTSSEETIHSIQQTADGSYVAAGSISSFSSGGKDFLVLKLSPAGNFDLPCKFLNGSSAAVSDSSVSPEDLQESAEDIDAIKECTDILFSSCTTHAPGYGLCSDSPLLEIRTTANGTTDPAPGIYIHQLGEEVSIAAIPESGYRLSEWLGDVTGSINPLTIVIDSDKLVIAKFVVNTCSMVIAAGEGGTTDPPPGVYTRSYGTEFTIKAIPESEYQFSEWSGDVTGDTNPITITLDSNKSVTANFVSIRDDEKPKRDIFIIECFIASAAYGSSSHPHVKVLREFRDRYLMSDSRGRLLVFLYYMYSPLVADVIEEHNALRVAFRITLLPCVVFSYCTVQFGIIPTAVILFSILLFSIYLIRLRRKKKV